MKLHSRKPCWDCQVFSKENSFFHFHWSSSSLVMTYLACRLTSLSGKCDNLSCHQLYGREIRKQSNTPCSTLQRILPCLWIPSQPVLGLSGWYKECSFTNTGTTCLIFQSPANLWDVSLGSHLVFHKKFWENYMFTPFSFTETYIAKYLLWKCFNQLYQGPCWEKAEGMSDSCSRKICKGSLVRKNLYCTGQILNWIAHLCCSLLQTRRAVKYLGLIKSKVGRQIHLLIGWHSI